MKITTVLLAQLAFLMSVCQAQADGQSSVRLEAEYYVRAYAMHYRVDIGLARAVIKVESDWQPCVVSSKGAVGLMQLMPATAKRLGVSDRCNVNQNIAGGIRYLAWLMGQFHNDLRLVTAAYYAGEDVVAKRGLAYRNPDVVAYVRKIRHFYLRQADVASSNSNPEFERDVQ